MPNPQMERVIKEAQKRLETEGTERAAAEDKTLAGLGYVADILVEKLDTLPQKFAEALSTTLNNKTKPLVGTKTTVGGIAIAVGAGVAAFGKAMGWF